MLIKSHSPRSEVEITDLIQTIRISHVETEISSFGNITSFRYHSSHKFRRYYRQECIVLFRAIGIASPKERAPRIHNARSFRAASLAPHPSRSRATRVYGSHSHAARVFCVHACVRGVRVCVRRAGDRSNGAEADSYYSRDLK